MNPCLTEEQLLHFVDDALSIEETAGARDHLSGCAPCRTREAALRTLIGDIRVPVRAPVDVRAHVEAVMARLDAPAPARRERGRRGWIAGSLAVAATVALVAGIGLRSRGPTDVWQARGGGVPAGVARDVGIQPYAVRGGLHALRFGDPLDADAALTAGFRNVGHAPAFLLLFAVDARGTVHWISPAYERPTDDPVATTLPVSAAERLLETTAALDDVAPGRLRIVSVVTATAAHVSDIESLPVGALDAESIVRRLPGASVHETLVEPRSADGAPP